MPHRRQVIHAPCDSCTVSSPRLPRAVSLDLAFEKSRTCCGAVCWDDGAARPTVAITFARLCIAWPGHPVTMASDHTTNRMCLVISGRLSRPQVRASGVSSVSAQKRQDLLPQVFGRNLPPKVGSSLRVHRPAESSTEQLSSWDLVGLAMCRPWGDSEARRAAAQALGD